MGVTLATRINFAQQRSPDPGNSQSIKKRRRTGRNQIRFSQRSGRSLANNVNHNLYTPDMPVNDGNSHHVAEYQTRLIMCDHS